MIQGFTKLNGYYKIFVIATFILIISTICEKYVNLYPHKSCIGDNIKCYFWRLVHYMVIIFITFFFIFFNIRTFNKDIVIFYSFMCITILHWYSGFCMISFLECKHYDIDIYNTETTIPHLRCMLGKKYANNVASILYIIGALNLLYITFLTKNNPAWFKYPFIIAFVISFYHNYILFDATQKFPKNLFTESLMANVYI